MFDQIFSVFSSNIFIPFYTFMFFMLFIAVGLVVATCVSGMIESNKRARKANAANNQRPRSGFGKNRY